MDLFYRMGKNNGYRTDIRGNRLAYTSIKIKLDGDAITAWNSIVVKKKRGCTATVKLLV